MDIRRRNDDFAILGEHKRRGSQEWARHTWSSDGSAIFLFGLVLPPNAEPRRIDVKIEVPPNLYDPTAGGRVFYRNLWVSAPVQVLVPGTRRFGPLPRQFAPDGTHWRFVCIHPGLVPGNENILTFLRVLQLFVRNADPRVW